MSDLVIVHWPGKDVPSCPIHLIKLMRLAAVMGFELSWTPCCDDEETQCSNCRTEKEKTA
jgi:hypothetical protein